MSNNNPVTLSILLSITLLTTGCGVVIDSVGQLFESKEVKAERKREMAELKAEIDSYGIASQNCVDVVRKNTDPSTLQFPKSMLNYDDRNTDNGWKVRVFAQDIKGSYKFTCYADKNGEILRVARDEIQQ